MAEIEYTGAALVVHVRGWDKVWALKSQLTIPIEHVIGAESASWPAGPALSGGVRRKRVTGPYQTRAGRVQGRTRPVAVGDARRAPNPLSCTANAGNACRGAPAGLHRRHKSW